MRLSSLLIAGLFGLAAHADDSTTTVGYFIPAWDNELLDYSGWTSTGASVAGINAEATTYKVGCLKDAATTDCDIKHSWTIVQGPGTVSMTGVYTEITTGQSESYGLTVTQSYECSFQSYSISASCTMSFYLSGTGEGATVASSTSTKTSYATAASSYYTLVVTGGVKSFTAPEATKTPGGAGAGAAAAAAGALITAAPVVMAVAALL
ncbi:hypothetical protein ASPZODRAFT_135978 [Penicilliopsis zonata CBS 506.65]|uniref:Ig-like domain-containing protein n=1 Tax=Penicilliopsis zonata CBS 506.65 TaxID=1073090 RepID=A0A1L9S8N5_9EURO|nr:hypothetical protein ASPZODRAFT_135978 [Penicilliopsis zonata CBS 506.65]OJJ43522.1 hypothetical protein ASPZODRAFT_135978 [Penicilliopsis zonata CBS 506.65]